MIKSRSVTSIAAHNRVGHTGPTARRPPDALPDNRPTPHRRLMDDHPPNRDRVTVLYNNATYIIINYNRYNVFSRVYRLLILLLLLLNIKYYYYYYSSNAFDAVICPSAIRTITNNHRCRPLDCFGTHYDYAL